MKKLIAGNWKMNGLKADLEQIARLGEGLTDQARISADILICPPATILSQIAEIAHPLGVLTGGQDCHWQASGAHTGDISAKMLAEAGASHVIVGHSERRTDHGETSQMVKQKAEAVQTAGLMPIICVGESFEIRQAGKAVEIVSQQVMASVPAEGDFVLAYEPIWAIGTGLVPAIDDINEIHNSLRAIIGPSKRILYGGSVKPGNAAEILSQNNVDGALVGGASLKAADFLGIINAAPSMN